MPIKVVLFDAYGTLFDVQAAARSAAQEPEMAALSDIWPDLATDWRDKQLQYSWLRAITGDHVSFWQITEDALDWALEAHGIEDAGIRRRLLALYRELSTYPEVRNALAELKETGLHTGILSNGSQDMLDTAVASAGMTAFLDQVLSADRAGVFKPAAAVYDLAGDAFGCHRDEVLFVSSNGWDVCSAAAYGFATLWVNRGGDPVDRLPARPQRVRNDLSGLRSLVEELS